MMKRSGLRRERARARAVSAVSSVIACGLAVSIAGCDDRNDKSLAATADSRGAPSAAPSSIATSSSPSPGVADAPARGVPAPLAQAESALSPEARKRFQKLLAEGRALHEKKDFASAVKSFQAALAVAPDDARALSEIGWSAFFTKDLDLAEASTRKSLERATEPYLKASGYYNLGRIQEERGKPDEAIASYRRSLEHRLNATVKARLAKLDPAAAAVFEILGATPLKGPFVSLEAYCDQASKKALPARIRCNPGDADLGEVYKGPTRVAGPLPPYLAVRVIASSRSPLDADGAEPPPPGGGITGYHLAVRTRIGWFIAEEAATTYNPGAFGIFEYLEVKELAMRDAIPGGAPELLLKSVHDRTDSNMGVNELEEYSDQTLMVCGVGPADKPSCTRPIPIAWSERISLISAEMDEPGAKHDLKDKKGSLSVAFLPSGELEIKGDAKELPDALKGLLGKHTLRFP